MAAALTYGGKIMNFDQKVTQISRRHVQNPRGVMGDEKTRASTILARKMRINDEKRRKHGEWAWEIINI